MEILVTGGGGYIGTCLVEELLTAGHRVRVFDRFFFGTELLAQLLSKWPGKLELCTGDVRLIDERPFDGIEGVVDLAGISNDPACALNPKLTRDINLEGGSRVAKLAVESGVERIVFASSCSVYGHGAQKALTEQSELNPITVYAECKVAGERRLWELTKGSATCATALRLATVFGLSNRMRFDLAVNIMTQHAYLSRLIRVDGGGQQWRPFVHVRDVARAFRTILESPKIAVNQEVFNVGSDENNLQIRSLAFRIRDRVPGSEIEMLPGDPDLRNYNVSFEKIKTALDFQTQYTIEDGVDEVVKALRDGRLNPDDRRWYTLKTYLFLEEVERTYRSLSLNGLILQENLDSQGDQ